MTTPTKKANGSSTTPRLVTEHKVHRSFPVLELRVDDPIPTPRAPERYAVQVYPDLARYLLGFNHPENRTLRLRHIKKYAADMRDQLWRFTPEPIIFSASGILQDGQNRLMAVTEYGEPVWFLFEFGWPDDIIEAIDRGAGRTVGDAIRHSAIPNPMVVAAAINKFLTYAETVGSTRAWTGLVAPSAGTTLAIYRSDPEGWQAAVHAGDAMYRALDRGLSNSMWAAIFRIIAERYPDQVGPFFDEVREGTGAPRSSTRVLRDWFMRRPITVTRSGDKRESIELAVRAFNAWRAGKGYSAVHQSGFVLSRVR